MKTDLPIRAQIIDGSLELMNETVLAVEIGRLRNVMESHSHSTFHIAKHKRVKRLVSIDTDENTERVCKQFLPFPMLEKVVFRNGTGNEVLADLKNRIDFLYIDGGADPADAMVQIKTVYKKMPVGGIIILDDCDASKGLVAKPYLMQSPFWEIVDYVEKNVKKYMHQHFHGNIVARKR